MCRWERNRFIWRHVEVLWTAAGTYNTCIFGVKPLSATYKRILCTRTPVANYSKIWYVFFEHVSCPGSEQVHQPGCSRCNYVHSLQDAVISFWYDRWIEWLEVRAKREVNSLFDPRVGFGIPEWEAYICELELGTEDRRDRIPMTARFSAAVHTGLGAHPASYTKDTGSFPGVKRPGRGVDHQSPSSAEVKERIELYTYSPLGLRDLL